MLLKRTIASIVGLTALFQSMIMPVYAENVCFEEGFDECITNAVSVDGLTLTGKNVHVVTDGKNKEISFQSYIKESALSFSQEVSTNNVVFSADITISDARSEGGFYDAVGGNVYVKWNGDGKITTYENRPIGSYELGKSFRIAVVLHGKRNTYDVYINGKKAADDIYVTNTIPNSMTDVKYTFKPTDSDERATIKMDNLAVYYSDVAKTIIPSAQYNEESTDFTEEVENTTAGNTTFAARTFDEENMGDFDYLSTTPKTNTIEIGKDKGNGNKYLTINKKTASDAFIEVTGFNGRYSYIVIEADMRFNGTVTGGIGSKDNNAQFEYLAYLNNGGLLTATDGKTIAALSQKKWTNVAFVADYNKLQYDIYVNKELLYKGVKMSNKNTAGPAIYRFHVWGGQGEFMFDNLKVYEGKEIRKDEDNTEIQESSIFYSDSDAQNLIGNSIALSLPGETLYANGKREKLDNPAYVTDGRTMIPVRAVSEGMGLNVNWDENSKSVSIGNDTVMKIGDKKMTVKGKELSADVAPQIKNDTAYLPLRILGEDVLGKKVFYDDRGLIVVSDNEFKPSTADIWHIFNYLTYGRQTDQELIDMFNKVGKDVHPRIMITQSDLDRIRKYYQTNPKIKRWSDSLIHSADAVLSKEPEKYQLNERENALLDVSRSVLERVQWLGFAYLITGDSKYPDRAWEELYSAGNFKDWCPTHYLDVAEMCAAFAIGYDWMYDYWTEEQRAFIAKAIQEKCLNDVKKVYMGRMSGWWANVEDNNWNAVCNGGAIMGAIATFEYNPELSAFVINQGMRGLEILEQSFYPSGAWPEGLGYWAYASYYMMMSYSSITSTFKTDFGLYKAPALSKCAEFVSAVNGTVASNNYHDSSAILEVPAQLMWLGKAYNDYGIMGVRLGLMNRYNWQGNLFDILFYDEAAESGNLKMPLDSYFPKTELVSMRESFDSATATFLSFHGGETFPNHGHSDGGAFVLDMLGERFSCDLGPDTYALPQYWSRSRPYYRQRAEGHSTIVINPDTSSGQDDGFAQVEKIESKDRGAISVLDLSQTYKSNVNKFERGYMLGDDRRSATIRDEIEFKDPSSNEVYWFMQTQADIEIADDNTAILSMNGKRVKLKFICSSSDATISEMAAEPLPTSPKSDPIELSREGYRKVAIHFTASDKAYIQVKIIPEDDPYANNEMIDEPIASWTIPDGEIQKLPVLEGIYSAGRLVTSFAPTVNNYSVNLSENTIPAVTVTASGDVAYDITMAKDASEKTMIKAYNKSNPQLYRMYSISYRLLPEAQGVNGMTRLQPVDVYASEVPQPENPEIGAIDNDLETRWSAEGDGQWLVIDFGSPMKFEKVGLAVMKGNERVQKFEIEISNDGNEWKQVYSGKTSGRTNDIELYDIGENEARFIKFVGGGNSANMWNSVTEFGAYHAN